MKVLKLAAICCLLFAFGIILVGRFSRLPSLDGRTTSTTLFDTGGTPLGKSIVPLVEAHPGSPAFIRWQMRALPSRRERAWPKRPSGRSISSITFGRKT